MNRNRVRVIGLVVIVALAAWLAVRSFGPQTPPPAPPQAPAREAFHAAKPLRVEIQRTAADGAVTTQRDWLERELRYLLARGKMKVAPIPDRAEPGYASQNTPDAPNTRPFTLRVTINEAASDAQLILIAADGVQERIENVAVASQSQLATIRSLAQRLPQFLGAPGGATDWSQHLGTTDAVAYETYVRSSDELLQPNAVGFTAPAAPSRETVANLERVETLARRQRDFARARALLSIAYLSVGGDDQASLAKLAETAAERALAADAQLADAHAALGIVRLRRMDWSAAQEHFDAALAIDGSSLPALEGLACLLLDVGHTKQALPIATRIAFLQPGSRGARQCAAYALIAQNPTASAQASEPFDVARIHASVALLRGDRAGAEALLKSDTSPSTELVDSVLDASTVTERVPEALQVITRSADDEVIDAQTEMLFGAALRRPDFVFNRMLRLVRQNEAVPLRLLWLPQTDFLRKHRRFKEVASAASLTTYWQDHGVPDVCTAEPKVHGCTVSASSKK
jgi:tetratricopeptide (TPR) repeat protein